MPNVMPDNEESNPRKGSSNWRELTAAALVVGGVVLTYLRPPWIMPLFIVFPVALWLLLWGRFEANLTRRDRAANQGAASARASTGLRTCPYCAEDVKAAATACRHCGRELEPVKAHQIAGGKATTEERERLGIGDALVAFAFPVVGLAVAMAYVSRARSKESGLRLAAVSVLGGAVWWMIWRAISGL